MNALQRSSSRFVISLFTNGNILLFSNTATHIMATKRPPVVEGNTPGKPEKKRHDTSGNSRKRLFTVEKPSNSRQWTVAENAALTQYICLFWEVAWTDRWPMKSDTNFWDACANVVNETCNSTRTGTCSFKGFICPCISYVHSTCFHIHINVCMYENKCCVKIML